MLNLFEPPMLFFSQRRTCSSHKIRTRNELSNVHAEKIVDVRVVRRARQTEKRAEEESVGFIVE